jgi:hypothetical protein
VFDRIASGRTIKCLVIVDDPHTSRLRSWPSTAPMTIYALFLCTHFWDA